MVKEEILTALRNSVKNGESLVDAKNILINSGYSQNDVEEASNYIGGVTSFLTPKRDENLTMPDERSLIKKAISPTQPITNNQNNYFNLSNELKKIGPQKRSHTKEIILFIILLLLIIGLALVFIFRGTLLTLFSSF